tara:strand:- start:45 stop:815 length:771 start_codon:yes stop_codon:yes gene_type:complete
MIINYLVGGLGNQLFQIAAGYSHSIDMQTSYAINYDFKSGYGQGQHPSRYKNTLYKKIKKTKKNIFKIVDQRGYAFAPIPKVDEICLRGYFQSEKFFKKNKLAIKNLFEFPTKIKSKIKTRMCNLNKKKNVGIHIRRGDYLKLSNTHPPISKEYIFSSLQLFEKENFNFLIFSDDIQFVRNEFSGENFKFMNNADEIEDLFALSICDSIIMSNSSFSWWANWLGKKKEKTIAPKNWFGPDGPKNTNDLYDSDWITI